MEGVYSATVNEDLPGPHSAIVAIKIQNSGRTPAFPVLIKCGFSVTQTLPNEPEYDRERTPAAIIRRDETVDIDIHAPIRLLALQDAEIVRSSTEISWRPPMKQDSAGDGGKTLPAKEFSAS